MGPHETEMQRQIAQGWIPNAGYRVWIGSQYPASCGYTHVAEIQPPEVSA